ncbi:hypothetical protein B1H26_23740 [Amycolatopsis sp. BJA-103]|nr:flavodoxin domain-containing protein [Amycolatopsis sp. BJA-103]AUI64561.1 hypothetical protein BKN51_20130 [Amycolatopsis sp. BJA-103]PNE16693.1 hypothetical protein B1H26_23740 [Amycolatopsis sp. BJA-103]
MRAMVVYESMFGNTEQVAKAVAEGLSPYAEVDVVNVDDVGSVAEAGLLVVGGPTHVHGMSWPSSRTEAGRQAVDGVRWLGFVPLAPPESFLVRTDKQEPVLRDGEPARARDWGAVLGKELAGPKV